jgi:hypothetical protein
MRLARDTAAPGSSSRAALRPELIGAADGFDVEQLLPQHVVDPDASEEDGDWRDYVDIDPHDIADPT